MPDSRRSSRKKRQTQLSFTPLPSSSPAASQYPEQIQKRAAAVRYNDNLSSPTKKRRLRGDLPDTFASSPTERVQIVVSSPSKGQLPTPAASSQVVAENENRYLKSSEPLRSTTGASRPGPTFGGRSAAKDGHSSTENDSDEVITPVRSKRRSKAAPIQSRTLSSDDDSVERTHQDLVTPTRRLRTRKALGTRTAESSIASDAEVSTKNLRSRAIRETKRNSNRIRASDIELESPNGDVTIIPSDGSSDISDEGQVITPTRKRRSTVLPKGQPPEQDSLEKDTSDDLQEELLDLKGTSDTVPEIRETRTRGRQVASERSKRQAKLEELRRRRAGIRDDIEEESYEEPSDDGLSSSVEPIENAMRRGSNLDEYEHDFVDDEDDTVGVDLGVAGVPLEYTYHANKKPFEHFKAEIEWMVHNKLNPAFDRYDEIYKLAHFKLDDEVRGYAGSKFVSSVWKQDFDSALKSRPEIYRIDVPTMHEHKCDACQRSGHPPKHKVTFTGKPYNRHTLEAIDKDDEEDDSSDTDGSKEQPHGEESSPDDGQIFFLGRFCCANAEIAHMLHHWRYALNQTVLQWLGLNGHLAPEKILARENMSAKKRQKAADKVVDGMVENGVTKILYKEFKENLKIAQEAKPTRFDYGS